MKLRQAIKIWKNIHRRLAMENWGSLTPRQERGSKYNRFQKYTAFEKIRKSFLKKNVSL